MPASVYTFPARGFRTPPPKCNSKYLPPTMPSSERKHTSPRVKADYYSEVHNLPPTDSPYGRAKHVQLVDKDPSRAISMFWAAINSGDRVDSALKDMAVVMKQLDRSDEAIEAIKSFRHLCPSESQESLNNILVELYKRSGRNEEQIEMLQAKLKHIEEGLAFGGQRIKSGKTQGKKIEITIEQEYARLLGNLAWVYLLQYNYKSAEETYRKSLSLEQDKNKQCNLAICLMHMNKMTEAKFLLQIVKDSCKDRDMDESYAKSYERALEILAELESQPGERTQPPFCPSTSKNLTESSNANTGQKRDFCNFSGVNRGNSKWGFQSSPQNSYVKNWGKSYSRRAGFGTQWSNDKWRGGTNAVKDAFACNKVCSSPVPDSPEVLLTQPKRCTWSFDNEEQKKAAIQDVHRKLNFGKPIDAGKFLAEVSEAVNCIRTGKASSDGDSDQNSNVTAGESVKSTETVKQIAEILEARNELQSQSKPPTRKRYQDFLTCEMKKSWADMVEEDEQDMLNGKVDF